MHARSCTRRTLFHLLWHPRTVFLDSERKVFRRKHAPCNQVDACFWPDRGHRQMHAQREDTLQQALHACLLARGVRLCAVNVGFVRYAAKQDLFVCNFIGVCRNHIALVLDREGTEHTPVLRRYMQALQELLEPLLTTKTRLVFFVFSLGTWRTEGRLLLRRVSA
jgi:hypothetical protein